MGTDDGPAFEELADDDDELDGCDLDFTEGAVSDAELAAVVQPGLGG